MGIGFGVQVRVGKCGNQSSEVRVVVGMSLEVRRGTVGGEGEGQ